MQVSTAFAAPSIGAYREDLRSRSDGSPFSRHDGVWLTVAGLVARDLNGEPPNIAAIKTVIEVVRDHLGPDAISRGCRHDPEGVSGQPEIDGCRILAEEMEQLGALRLAASLIDNLHAIPAWAALDRGRLLAHRARIAWKLGDVDGARDRYRQLEVLARRIRNDELRVRAWIGFGALAQIGGNYPAVEAFAKKAMKLAERRGFVRLAALARTGLLACAARRGEFSDALMHAWEIFKAAHDDPTTQVEIIANMGRLLFDMGQPRAAQAAYIQVISRSRAPRLVLPALGGLALASAACNDARTVDWAVRQVLTGTSSHSSLYEFAVALYESAEALAAGHKHGEAESLREQAMRLATTNEYHEVRYRAGEIRIIGPAALAPERRDTRAIIQEILDLRPRRLPARVRLDRAETGRVLTSVHRPFAHP